MTPLNILHVLRAPVGGLIRHVIDLTRGQIARGHRVGIIADSGTGGARAEENLASLAPQLALGISRIPMPRQLGPADLPAFWHVTQRVKQTNANILHGHSAKGGAYSRLALAPKNVVRVYTPHGGSLHFKRNTIVGLMYHSLEKLLMPQGNLYLFESAFARDRFKAIIGTPRGLVRVVCNGVTNEEFEPITRAPDASDVAYVGEFRHIKGADLVIDALKLLENQGRRISLTLAGDGEETKALHAQVARHGLAERTRFAGFQPARVGFSLGRVLIVPSRADSLPYVVIEAAAAGIPMIATRVGGIPEIFGSEAGRLVPPENPAAIAAAIASALDEPGLLARSAAVMQSHVREHFSQDAMVDGVLAAYREALDGARST